MGAGEASDSGKSSVMSAERSGSSVRLAKERTAKARCLSMAQSAPAGCSPQQYVAAAGLPCEAAISMFVSRTPILRIGACSTGLCGE